MTFPPDTLNTTATQDALSPLTSLHGLRVARFKELYSNIKHEEKTPASNGPQTTEPAGPEPKHAPVAPPLETGGPLLAMPIDRTINTGEHLRHGAHLLK